MCLDFYWEKINKKKHNELPLNIASQKISEPGTNNSIYQSQKNNNYSNVIESIKNRQILSDEDYSKFYQLDKLAKSIKEVNIEEEIKKNCEIKKEDDKDIEQISLSQSLHSQDNGKTFKDIICFNKNKDKHDENNIKQKKEKLEEEIKRLNKAIKELQEKNIELDSQLLTKRKKRNKR